MNLKSRINPKVNGWPYFFEISSLNLSMDCFGMSEYNLEMFNTYFIRDWVCVENYMLSYVKFIYYIKKNLIILLN